MRKDRVFEILVQHFIGEKVADQKGPGHQPQGKEIGLTAAELARLAGIDRSNASRDLNQLVREGKLVKIPGRPVRFRLVDLRAAPQEGNAAAAPKAVGSATTAVGAGAHLVPKEKGLRPVARGRTWTATGSGTTASRAPSTAPAALLEREESGAFEESWAFAQLIGFRGSLKTQVEQGMAAILYPPNGLHTLLLGPTGSGKNHFARVMYQFALEKGRLAPGAPFVSFNCADYAHNSQLLLSQLFGYRRGAFTGAIHDQPGLVEKADQGILFLDEVHRLPPEGQEMLFQLMDTGEFRRLGETDGHRRATVLIIAATSQNPEEVLLKTFYRRIPMVIRLPSLSERPREERLELLQAFFAEEARQTRTRITVTDDVIDAFLAAEYSGNVGQLKNDVRLVCARAFVKFLAEGGDGVRVTRTLLPAHVRQALVHRWSSGKEMDSFLGPQGDLVFYPTAGEVPWRKDPTDLYETIERTVEEFQREGLTPEEIDRMLTLEIESYFRRFVKGFGAENRRWEEIIRLVGPSVVEATRAMLALAEAELDLAFDERVFRALAMHLKTSLERMERGGWSDGSPRPVLKGEQVAYFPLARRMVEVWTERTGTELPPEEASFIAMFLQSVARQKEDEKRTVGVVVIAHGSQTAAGMAEVANRLLGHSYVYSLNVSLDEMAEQILNRAENLVRQADRGSGVVLLVDMGPLVFLGEIISQRTGIPTLTLDRVNTPLVLEVARKALAGYSLDSLSDFFQTGERKPGPSPAGQEGSPAAYKLAAVCITGAGSAEKIKGLLNDRLPALARWGIQILAAGLADRHQMETLRELAGRGDLLAVVGTINPGLAGIPFVSLEEILLYRGLEKLEEILRRQLELAGALPGSSYFQVTRSRLFHEIRNTLLRQSRFLNPDVVLRSIHTMITDLEERLGFQIENDVLAGLVMHLAASLEKKVTNPGGLLQCRDKEEIAVRYPREVAATRAAAEVLRRELDFDLSEDEICNLVKIIRQVPLLDE